MIEVRVRDKDVPDAAHLIKRQGTDTGARIDKDILIDQE
jgi:hypothetical protein